MEPGEIRQRGVEREFVYSASRSSGPGGQNVNKVSSKVELRFNLWASNCFSYAEKQLISQKLGNKINLRGELVIESQTERSQLRNKENVIEKFFFLVARALTIQKKRKPTRPTNGSRLRRLESKKKQANKKSMRKPPKY